MRSYGINASSGETLDQTIFQSASSMHHDLFSLQTSPDPIAEPRALNLGVRPVHRCRRRLWNRAKREEGDAIGILNLVTMRDVFAGKD
jgi:hypothetical protein